MKKIFSILIFICCAFNVVQSGDDVISRVTVTQLRHNYDCGNDAAGVCCGCWISICDYPEPRWNLRSGYSGTTFQPWYHWSWGTNNCGIWDITDFNLMNDVDIGAATQLNVDAETWEEDGCGADNTYNNGCANDDDVHWGASRLTNFNFRGLAPCTTYDQGWFYTTDGYGARIQTRYWWADPPTFTTAPTANGTTFTVCPGIALSFTSATNTSDGWPVGRFYQWQSSTDNVNFFDNGLPATSDYSFSTVNATGSTITTYYRLRVTSNCTADFSSRVLTSGTITVNVLPSSNGQCNLPTCNTIYVDPVNGNDGNAQPKPNSPWRTLQKALSSVSTGNTIPYHIKIATGTTPEPSGSPIIMQSNVLVEGGYVAGSGQNDWQKSSNPSLKTTIGGNYFWDARAGVFGIIAGLNSSGGANTCNNWRLQDLTITTSNGSAHNSGVNSSYLGLSTYGVYISGCSNYEIVRCDISPGSGAPGGGRSNFPSVFNGQNGNPGAVGQTGGAAESSCNPTVDAGGSGGAGGGGGLGGNNASIIGSGAGGTGSTGGNGGNGTNDNGNDCWPSACAGVGGGMTGTCSGGGGAGGSSDAGNNDTPYGGNGASCGTVGAAGSNGSTTGVASHSGGFYVPGSGSNGSAGGGGGGGAGGGGAANDEGNCDAGGGGGSGGSGGGGGGGAGGGGRGGGGSFAVYVWAGGSGGTILDCKLAAGSAGSGGLGGLGGSGGAGGAMSAQGNSPGDANRGGRGGAGSTGGTGGTGASGSTGVSYALAYQGGGNAPSVTLPNISGGVVPTVNSTTTTVGAVNNPTNTTLLSGSVRNNMPGKFCVNSEIDMTKAAGSWGAFPQTTNGNSLNFVQDLKTGLSSYDAADATIKVYATTGGSYNITVNSGTMSRFLTVASTSEFNRTWPVIAASPTSICEGGTGISLTVTSNSYDVANILEREWKIYLDGSPTPGVTAFDYNGNSVTSVSFSAASVTTGTFNTDGTYIVRYRERHNCCGWSRPSFTTFTVANDPSAPVLTRDPAVTTVCAGTSVRSNITIPSDGISCTPTLEYSIDNGTWTAYTNNTFIGAAATSSISIRAIRNCTGNGCTPQVSATETWAVVPQPSILVQPEPVSVCNGATPGQLSVQAIEGVGLTYQWQSNSTSCASTFTNTGGNSQTLAYSTSSNGTTYYRAVITSSANTGCSTLTSNCVAVTIIAQPTSGTLSKTPNVATVCEGTALSVSQATAGANGVGCSDIIEYRTRTGGVWTGWTTGSGVTTTSGMTDVEMRTYRGNCTSGTECNSSAPNVVSWTVVPQPQDPVSATKSPALTSVCSGTTVGLTSPTGGNAGSGCQFEYRFQDAGSATWTAWSTTSSYTTTGTGSGNTSPGAAKIEVRRGNCTANAGCTTSPGTLRYTWDVVAQPASGTITRSPVTAFVCQGTSVSATFNGNSGGTGCTDFQEYRTNNGSGFGSWQTYTGPVSSTGLTAIEIRTYRGNCTANAGCTASTPTVESWSVLSQFNPGAIVSTREILCDDNPTTITTTTPAVAGAMDYAYQWYYMAGEQTCPTGTNFTGWIKIPGANSPTYDPPANDTVKTFARSVDATGSPDCAVETWSSGCRIVYPSSGSALNVLSTITTSKTCVVNDNKWHFFRNNNGELIAAINSNGQNLGNVTLAVNVDSLKRTHGNGGFGHNQDCLGTSELSMGRFYTVTTQNTPANGVTNLRLYYNNNDYTAYEAAIVSYVTGPPAHPNYGMCYGYPQGPGTLAISRNETNDMAASNTVPVTPSYIVTTEMVLPPSLLRIRETGETNTTQAGPTTFRWHTEGGIGAPLPVELVSFIGWNEGDVNQLQWITVSEQNTDVFIVEKNTDAASPNWTYVGSVPAAGNSNAPLTYNLTDANPVIGNNYYRLKIVDRSGEFEYSNIINIPVNAIVNNQVVGVYPNPTSGILNIDIQSVEKFNTQLKVYDILGQEVHARTIVLEKGLNKIQMNYSSLPKATYILYYLDNFGKQHQVKFIKD